MRLVFITLVILNLAISIWGFFLRGGDAGVVVPAEHVGTVQGADKSDGGESTAGIASNAEGSEAKSLCDIVGPFPELGGAENFTERLRSIDIQSEIKELDLPAGQSYWVYLEPVESDEAAHRKLAELQSQGVESYIVRRGVLKNAISLGMYTYENLADDRISAMRSKGLTPKKEIIERTQIEIWVMLAPGESQKMSDLTWDRALADFSSQERRQNFCLDVASGDNIH